MQQTMNSYQGLVPNHAGATILAIDDREDLLSSVQVLLQAYRFHVLTSTNGEQACQLLTEHRVDLVILDLRMKGLSGYQLMDRLQREHPDLPFIVVSGETSFSSVSRVLKAGAYDFIRKPYGADELINSIKHALQQRSLTQQKRLMQEQIKASEALHRFMVNHSPDIIYMLDQDGRFTYLNQSITRLLNYTPEDLLGERYHVLLNPDERNQHDFVFNERRTGNRKTVNREIQLRRHSRSESIACPGATTLCFEVTAMGVYDSDTDPKAFQGSYGIARDITARKQAESVIHFQAYHDLLTGLPNRSLLKDRLQQTLSNARRCQERLVVMFLDLDRFKIVNDTLGHSVGDQLLQAVSRRLQSCIREGDTLARFGGDEFALLLPRVRQQDDAAIIADKILQVLEAPFLIDEHELSLSASIGIALYPEAGEDMDTLIQHADMAMYQVKNQGKNGYQFFSKSMQRSHTTRLP